MDNRNQQDKQGQKLNPNDRNPNEQKPAGSQDRDRKKNDDQSRQHGNPPKH